MSHAYKILYSEISDKGIVRKENQDSCGKFPADIDNTSDKKGIMLILADGMGGHSKGGEASRLAVHVVAKHYFGDTSEDIENSIKSAIAKANSEIFELSGNEIKGMGTTCTVLVLTQDLAYIGHVGDSRIYKIRKNKIIQLTKDHKFVNELQHMGVIRKKDADKHPAKSVLLRAVGIEPEVKVEIIGKIKLKAEDFFILCSDGLLTVNNNDIKDIVIGNPLEKACEKLVELAINNGSRDNITIQVVKISEPSSTENIPKKRKVNPIFAYMAITAIIIFCVLLYYQNFIDDSYLYDLELNQELLDENESYNTDIKYDQQTVLFRQAKVLFDNGELEKSLVLYQNILEKNSTHLGAIENIKNIADRFIVLGNSYYKKENYDTALKHYEKAASLKTLDEVLTKRKNECKVKIKDLEMSKDTI